MIDRKYQFCKQAYLDHCWWIDQGVKRNPQWTFRYEQMLTAKDALKSLRKLAQPEFRWLSGHILSKLAEVNRDEIQKRSLMARIIQYADIFTEAEVAEARDRLAAA